ncbi:Aste57867_579 [Aphanomyces stellatus]|uniref:Aste57867_579 protein n=1 Tax=Aphanomyces stellatus TaxID=120398 RepID=A0A485K667_9STRA|nr:hypothetical protein As57867_000578 [Aphanomyces stellatus]VFT77804.1 Aste57867_579 [Aphanomyces stellatus]
MQQIYNERDIVIDISTHFVDDHLREPHRPLESSSDATEETYMIHPMATPIRNTTCVDLTEEDGDADGLSAFLWTDKSIRRVPQDWTFPSSMPQEVLWLRWFVGVLHELSTAICPFRWLSEADFEDDASKAHLATARAQVTEWVKVAKAQGWISSLADVESLLDKGNGRFETLLANVLAHMEQGAPTTPQGQSILSVPSIQPATPVMSPLHVASRPTKPLESSPALPRNISDDVPVLRPPENEAIELGVFPTLNPQPRTPPPCTTTSWREMWRLWVHGDGVLHSGRCFLDNFRISLSPRQSVALQNSMRILTRLAYEHGLARTSRHLASMTTKGLDRVLNILMGAVEDAPDPRAVYDGHELRPKPTTPQLLVFPHLSVRDTWRLWFHGDGGMPYHRRSNWTSKGCAMRAKIKFVMDTITECAVANDLVTSIDELEGLPEPHLMKVLDCSFELLRLRRGHHFVSNMCLTVYTKLMWARQHDPNETSPAKRAKTARRCTKGYKTTG